LNLLKRYSYAHQIILDGRTLKMKHEKGRWK
jgi:hypothetical protein